MRAGSSGAAAAAPSTARLPAPTASGNATAGAEEKAAAVGSTCGSAGVGCRRCFVRPRESGRESVGSGRGAAGALQAEDSARGNSARDEAASAKEEEGGAAAAWTRRPAAERSAENSIAGRARCGAVRCGAGGGEKGAGCGVWGERERGRERGKEEGGVD